MPRIPSQDSANAEGAHAVAATLEEEEFVVFQHEEVKN